MARGIEWRLALTLLVAFATSAQAIPLTADFNGDGLEDLVVGEPGRQVNQKDGAGAVSVYYGRPAGLPAAPHARFDQEHPDLVQRVEAGDRFGAALVVADFDRDGFDDLAMGVPHESFEHHPFRTDHIAGRVVVAYGGSSGLRIRGGGVSDWDRDSVGVESPRGGGDLFGAALGVGDFNHDGIADLVVGVPFEDLHATSGAVLENAGVAQVLYGTAQGLSALPELGRQMLSGGRNSTREIRAAAGDLLGSSFAP